MKIKILVILVFFSSSLVGQVQTGSDTTVATFKPSGSIWRFPIGSAGQFLCVDAAATSLGWCSGGGGSGPAPGNPTGLIGFSAANGSDTTYTRSDATHALDSAALSAIYTRLTYLRGVWLGSRNIDSVGTLVYGAIPYTLLTGTPTIPTISGVANTIPKIGSSTSLITSKASDDGTKITDSIPVFVRDTLTILKISGPITTPHRGIILRNNPDSLGSVSPSIDLMASDCGDGCDPGSAELDGFRFETRDDADDAIDSLIISNGSQSLGWTPLLKLTQLSNGGFGYTWNLDNAGSFSGSNGSATSAPFYWQGMALTNPGPATSGFQANSPAIYLAGNGWKTASTAASELDEYYEELIPTQGSTHSTSSLSFNFQIGGGGWTTPYTFSNAGVFSASTGYQIGGAATTGNVLRGNGTNFVSAQLAYSDLSGTPTVITGSGYSPSLVHYTGANTIGPIAVGATSVLLTDSLPTDLLSSLKTTGIDSSMGGSYLKNTIILPDLSATNILGIDASNHVVSAGSGLANELVHWTGTGTVGNVPILATSTLLTDSTAATFLRSIKSAGPDTITSGNNSSKTVPGAFWVEGGATFQKFIYDSAGIYIPAATTTINGSATDRGYLIMGPSAGQQVQFDNDEIQSMNNTTPATFYLNYAGGQVVINGGASTGGLSVHSFLGVATTGNIGTDLTVQRATYMTDAALAVGANNSGNLVIGNVNGQQLQFDLESIQSWSNTVPTTLNINQSGGSILLGNALRVYSDSAIFFGKTEFDTSIYVDKTVYANEVNTSSAAYIGGALHALNVLEVTGVGIFSDSVSVTKGIGVGTNVKASGNIYGASLHASSNVYVGNAIVMSSVEIWNGSGAPSFSSAKGSFYLRTDGSAANNRLYINTDGGSTWTYIVTGI